MEKFKSTIESKNSAPEIKRHGRLAELNTSDANYTLVYVNHEGPFLTPVSPNELHKNIDFLVVETGTTGWREVDDFFSDSPFVDQLKYRVEKENIKVLMLDIAMNQDVAKTDLLLPYILHTSIGASLIIGVAKALIKEKSGDTSSSVNKKDNKISRRKFMKLGSRAVAGVWLLLPTVADIIGGLAIKNNAYDNIFPEIKKLSDLIHPEAWIFIDALRNAVFAYKEQWLARHQSKPNITTIIGGAHVGVEDRLVDSREELLEYIKAFKPILKNILVKPEEFYSIKIHSNIIFSDKKNNKPGQYVNKVIEIPELKELLS